MMQKIVGKLLQLTGGRSTAFFIMFFVSGTAMAWVGKLDHTYVDFMIGLGGLVVVHSGKDDYFAKKAGGGSDDGKG